METTEASAMAEIISDLSFEYDVATEEYSQIIVNDPGNIEGLSRIKHQVSELAGKIALERIKIARSVVESEPDEEKLSELSIKCDNLLDLIIEATG